MNAILLATIPAVIVLIAMLSVRFLEHHLQSKREVGRQELERERETRDARRKYRESIVTPIREALVMFGSTLHWESRLEIIRKVEEKGRIKAEVADLKKDIESITKRESVRIYTEILPKVATITNLDTREFLEVIFRGVFILINTTADILPEELQEANILDEVGINVKNLKEKLNLAHQKLEDYVALAD